MLSELERRKPNFDEVNSVRVVLADGQRWALPKPWVEIRPVFRNGAAVDVQVSLTYGPHIDALIASVGVAETWGQMVSAVASLAAWMLCWHYDLADDDLDELLAYRVGDPVSSAWIEQVTETATGRSGPKAGSAGGD